LSTTRKNNINVHTLRQFQIIERAGSVPYIKPAEEIRERITFLKDFARSSHTRGFVLGISGGLDSALAGKLCQIAVEELRAETNEDYKFIAVRLPYGEQIDEADAQVALDFIQADEVRTFNIKPSVDAFQETFNNLGDDSLTDFVKGNVKARMRMVAQYAIAGQQNLLVVGTDQAVEFTMGFYTKHGDGAADILPISGLTKDQEVEIMRVLGSPESIINKIPTADLLEDAPALADEQALGVTYASLNAYLKGTPTPVEVAEKIEEQFSKTEHKRHLPVTPFDNWWR
jgi:NAD+ synthase